MPLRSDVGLSARPAWPRRSQPKRRRSAVTDPWDARWRVDSKNTAGAQGTACRTSSPTGTDCTRASVKRGWVAMNLVGPEEDGDFEFRSACAGPRRSPATAPAAPRSTSPTSTTRTSCRCRRGRHPHCGMGRRLAAGARRHPRRPHRRPDEHRGQGSRRPPVARPSGVQVGVPHADRHVRGGRRPIDISDDIVVALAMLAVSADEPPPRPR
jgi:hypothetical protein